MTNNDHMGGRLLSTHDLAERWGISIRTITRLIDRREIHFIRVGRQIRFKLADILAYEKTNRS